MKSKRKWRWTRSNKHNLPLCHILHYSRMHSSPPHSLMHGSDQFPLKFVRFSLQHYTCDRKPKSHNPTNTINEKITKQKSKDAPNNQRWGVLRAIKLFLKEYSQSQKLCIRKLEMKSYHGRNSKYLKLVPLKQEQGKKFNKTRRKPCFTRREKEAGSYKRLKED